MWIYEYSRFDQSGFLPEGPYDTLEEAYRAMRDHADRFGTRVKGPRQVEDIELPTPTINMQA
ncbi:MAG: hypothetical protein GXX84_12455 [Acidobacteria bacterium]|nr:hypothetical protein [Acidobacteriota bacterium]